MDDPEDMEQKIELQNSRIDSFDPFEDDWFDQSMAGEDISPKKKKRRNGGMDEEEELETHPVEEQE